MRRFRIAFAAVIAAIAALAFFSLPHGRAVAQSSCGETTFVSDGVEYRVLFAKNGAVQQYVLSRSSHNIEQDHDALKAAQAKYGQAGVNAPPLQIVSFRPGSGGMMVPDKAVDSCGRVSYFK